MCREEIKLRRTHVGTKRSSHKIQFMVLSLDPIYLVFRFTRRGSPQLPSPLILLGTQRMFAPQSDSYQTVEDRRDRAFARLHTELSSLPEDLVLTNEIEPEEELVAGGGYCDVYRGYIRRNSEHVLKGKAIAIRKLRIFLQAQNGPKTVIVSAVVSRCLAYSLWASPRVQWRRFVYGTKSNIKTVLLCLDISWTRTACQRLSLNGWTLVQSCNSSRDNQVQILYTWYYEDFSFYLDFSDGQ